MNEGHLPVLVEEVIEMLAPAPGSLHIDATLGGGGHAERVLEAANPDGRLLGLDADALAIARVEASAGRASATGWLLRQANFRELADVAPDGGLRRRRRRACSTSACRATSWPIDDRGFGFRAGGPLDMRFDTSRGVPAAELLATLDAAELTALFRRYGEEPKAPPDRPGDRRRASRRARSRPPRSSPPSSNASPRRNPRHAPPDAPRDARLPGAPDRRQRGARGAARPALAAALDLLRPGGRLVVLSYHSLEDRIVKRFFQAERRGCVCPPDVPICVCGRNPRLRLVTRPSLTPDSGRDRRQPTRPECPPAGRRATRRLTPPASHALVPEGGVPE